MPTELRYNPTDRGKARSKYHLLVDAHGLPLNVLVSAASRHDSLFVESILDWLPGIKRGGRGRPRRRPIKLHGEKGYEIPRVRRYLRRRGIAGRIAWIGVDSISPRAPTYLAHRPEALSLQTLEVGRPVAGRPALDPVGPSCVGSVGV